MSKASKNRTYSKDGVDVEEESLFSSFAGSICKDSYANSPYVEIHDFSRGNFRGPRPFSIKNLPEGYFLEASTDGIGTKGILIDAAKTHRLAAFDIMAMTASDITRFGGLPLIFINVFDTVSVGEEGDEVNNTYKSVIRGLGEVAEIESVVLLKGETAQMTESIGSEIKDSKTKINWSGTMIGVYYKEKMITGDDLASGQVVVALKEDGFRCNGISSVRKAFRSHFGDLWWENPEAKESLKLAATPSVLYDPLINTLHGWFAKDLKPEVPIYAVIHLSGGAIKEKFAKDMLFPRGLSAKLDDLWEPPLIMRQCAEWRGVSDEEFYEMWNGGQGMMLAIDEDKSDYVIKRARDFGISARVAGKITKESKPLVSINSKLTKGKKIVYK
jgi:phosphoribosylformylglycinamidine cyclo-ligase